ncbi:MAG: Bug family tripartite tricarboxylate transporter substrate binding protein [Burkholderiaceae bacterium]
MKMHRNLSRRQAILAIGATASMAALPNVGSAQSYPSRPVRIIVPFPAGGGTDAATRLMAKVLETHLNQPVIVDNLPGGSALVAQSALKNAPADGYTMMITGNDMVTVLRHLQKVPFDIHRDFSYIGRLIAYPMMLIGRGNLAANSPAEVFDLIRKSGKKLNYATYGTGSSSHIGMELLLQRLGAQMTPIPYKGGAPAALGILAGDVDLMIGELTTFSQYVTEKRLKAFAMMENTRSAALPDVPTVEECGFPGFNWMPWTGGIMRADVPPEISARLSTALRLTLSDKALQQTLESRGMKLAYMDPKSFRDLVVSTDQQMEKLIAGAQIKTN